MKRLSFKHRKGIAWIMSLLMILSVIPFSMLAKPEEAFASVITEATTIVYGTKGGGSSVLTGTYAKQGDALTESDSVAEGGAVTWINAKYHSTGYGIYVGNGSSLKINVTGDTKISFVTSQYNSSGKVISVTSTDSTGVIDDSGIKECKVAADGDKLTVVYTAGKEESATLTFDFSGTIYVPALIIEPIKEDAYLAKGTTTKVIFTGSIDVTNAGDYTDDLNDLKGSYKEQTDYLVASDLKQADDAVVLSSAKYHGKGYGLYIPASSTLDINVAGSATITMMGSTYSSEGNITAVTSDSNGKFENASVSTKPETDKGNITIKYNGDGNAKLTLTFGANTYLGNIIVSVDEEKQEVALDTSKVDVWDFGAEALDSEKYNNNFTTDIINAFYPSVEAGTSGKNISSFIAKDAAGVDAVKFNDGGYSTTHRWRTTNKSLTRYDEKSKADADGTKYTGYIYSNKSSTDSVNLEVYLYEGDIFTVYLGSNSSAALYNLTGPDGNVYDTFNYSNTSGIEKATFYADSEGWYKLWSSNEKLVCARIMREHVPTVKVSGNVSAPSDIPEGYKLVFTNTITKAQTEVSVSDGKYEVSLSGKYSYDVSLKDANGYVVSSSSNNVKLESTDKEMNINIESVSLVTLTGGIKNMPVDKLDDLKLIFGSDNVYVPEFSLDKTNGSFTLKVETGVKYTVTAENVNDYSLDTTSIVANENGSKDIVFTKKTVYPVTVDVTGVTDTTGAKVTFANINEEGYSYTFNVDDKVALRDGQYSVKISGIASVPVVQGATADVIIKGSGTTVTIPMTEISSWDFAVLNNTNKVETINGGNYYAGLKLTSNVNVNKTYLLANASAADSVITVPNVKKGSQITIKYCYCASFTAGDKTVDEKSGSTTQIDSIQVTATEDGDFVITSKAGTKANQTYFCSIEVKEQSDYKEVLYVGADKEFKTINDALDAVRKMSRTEDQAVTIKIDPGNYEEMLVIDMPNIKLQNASKTPSIALKNKGVDIDDNAVRITWYYGHGYTYYSMGSDCKYDADLLEVNKANGYASFTNPGSGTTNGSYWNATVVVSADNFTADGIIFENSFNQYVSAKSVEDVIEPQSGAKEGSIKRADMKTVGDTKVQEKEYVERAAALAIYNNVSQAYFNNCKFVGRQDTLYGGTGVTAAFNKCDILGGTDYIFGGMTAVFKSCNLVFNTNDQTDNGNKNDVGYITAPQQSSGRGYLLYECHVTSTTPGVDTASTYTSKPGYLGRPWQANTGEAVFYNTTVDAADSHWNTDYSYGESLISPLGWLTTLGGQSTLCGEYGTIEKAEVDNSSSRADWAQVFTEPKLADGTDITIKAYLGSWNPFAIVESTPDPSEGDIKVDVDQSEDAPEVTLPDSVDEIIDDIMTEEEKKAVEGKDVKVSLSVDKKDNVTEEEKKAIESKIDSNQIVAMYLDINLFMSVDGTKNAITDTNKALSITINIPENLINTDASKTRKFSVIRIHNGVAEILKTSYDESNNKLTFETDKFSTYVLVYEDTDKESDGTKVEDKAPSTGDAAPIAMLITLLGLSGLGLLSSRKKRV